MRLFNIFILVSLSQSLSGQTAGDIIAKVRAAQGTVQTVSYLLSRTDTLVTDDVRTMTGSVAIAVDTSDQVFGFRFWAMQDGETLERLYDGRTAFILDTVNKTYTATTESSGIRSLLSGGGGRLVFPDLVRLQIGDTVSSELSIDSSYYYLKLNYPDVPHESVVKRSKLLKIDRRSLLPVAMRSRQETYDKVQDLYYEVRNMRINDAAALNKLDLAFLAVYKEESKLPAAKRIAISTLINQNLPPFDLESFDSARISSQVFKGDVILIDLWELWCAPCIASMPRVDNLYQKYKEEGLKVYGITSDKRSLSAARKMIAQKNIAFPILIADEEFRKNYFSATTPLPMYILIDRSGKIVHLFPGFSDQIEAGIQRLLAARP